MKLARVARNVILAGIGWRWIAQRRQALARERRARKIAPVLIAGGAGIVWAARPRILAGAQRVLEFMQRRPDRNADAPHERSQAKAAKAEAPPREQKQPNVRVSQASPGPSAEPPPNPSPKKRRRRARQKRAAQRENTERQSARGGAVKVGINQPEELRAPIGEIKH